MPETCDTCTPPPPTSTAVLDHGHPAQTPHPVLTEFHPVLTEAVARAVSPALDHEGNPIPPPGLTTPQLLIQFCDRCRWAPRASWVQTELMLTFPPPLIATTSLQPLNTPETAGRFRVWLERGSGWELVWDRKCEGGFPELKVLKQRVRNLVQPEMSLGHSDAKDHA